jgi:histidine triad (HIT) family protein
MADCIFCKIVDGEIPAKVVYSDDDVVAIADINPQAPEHVVVMPRKHYANVSELAQASEAELGHLFAVASQIGAERGSNGFRLVANTGEQGGQTVDHVHVHVLSGRPMSWPPG